jgi:hypothetical protein
MTLLLDITQAAQDRPVLALALVVSILVAVLAVATSTQEYPRELPWVGKDDSKSFAATRATYSSIKNVNKWLAEGYQEVGLPLRFLKHQALTSIAFKVFSKGQIIHLSRFLRSP